MNPTFQVYNTIRRPQNIYDLETNYSLENQFPGIWFLKHNTELYDNEYISGERLTLLMKKAVNFDKTFIQSREFKKELILLSLDENFQNFARGVQGIENAKTKWKRAAKIASQIGKGLNQITEKGMIGKTLCDNYFVEAATRNHIYDQGNYYFMYWEKSSTRLNFEDWMIRRNYSPYASRVIYGNEDQREKFRLSFKDGRAFRGLYSFKTFFESTARSGPGHAIFVIDSNEQFYAGSHEEGQFHHSSFLAGGAVIGAGEIQTNDLGQVIAISNKSGHYKPNIIQALQTLHVLEKNGVDLVSIKFTLLSDFGSIVYNAKEFYDTKGNCDFNFQNFHFRIDSVGEKCIFLLFEINKSKNLFPELMGNVAFARMHYGNHEFIYREMLLSGLFVEYPMLEYISSEGNMLPIKWEGGELHFQNGNLAFLNIRNTLDKSDYDFLYFLQCKGVNLRTLTIEKEGVFHNGEDYFRYLDNTIFINKLF